MLGEYYMHKFMRKIAYSIILFVIMAHLVPLLFMIATPLVRNVILSGTYVELILSPKKGDQIKKALDKFNNLGYNNAVKYEGRRPIFIYEANLPDGVLGRAMPNLLFCAIEISSKIDDDSVLEDTVMHEMIHCFFYLHSDVPCTLMYYNYDPRCPKQLMELSKEQYAKEIAEKFYE